MVPCMFLLYTYPEDPASANNANIRQRARKPMTLVRFLKCHQIWPTFISSDFMVDCASDNTTKSRFTASHHFFHTVSAECAGEQSAASISSPSATQAKILGIGSVCQGISNIFGT